MFRVATITAAAILLAAGTGNASAWYDRDGGVVGVGEEAAYARAITEGVGVVSSEDPYAYSYERRSYRYADAPAYRRSAYRSYDFPPPYTGYEEPSYGPARYRSGYRYQPEPGYRPPVYEYTWRRERITVWSAY